LYANNAIQTQADHMWSNLSQSVKDDYGKEEFDEAIKKMISYTSGGVNMKLTKLANNYFSVPYCNCFHIFLGL